MMDVVAHTNTAASALILTGGGALAGAILTAGSDAATLIIYDNTSAAGTVVAKLAAPAANTTAVFAPGVKLPVYTGLYAALTGTTPSATLLFTP